MQKDALGRKRDSVIIKDSVIQSLEFSSSMLRFLQTPGPMKKIVLGGLLLVICVMMVITLVPGGLFGDYFGGGVTTPGLSPRLVLKTSACNRSRSGPA